MRLKTWLVAALGLGSLVVLIALSMLASSRRAQAIYSQLDQLNTHHRNVEARLRALRSDVQQSSIFVRDYLLDVARERAPEYREELAGYRAGPAVSAYRESAWERFGRWLGRYRTFILLVAAYLVMRALFAWWR